MVTFDDHSSSSKQRHIRSLLHHGHKPLTSTGPYRFLSLSNRGPSRRPDETGFVIRPSPITSQVEVELPTFTITPLEHSSELYWKLNTGSIEHGHGHALHQSVARAESFLSMIEEGRIRGFLRGGSCRTFHWKKLVVRWKLYRIQYADELREPSAGNTVNLRPGLRPRYGRLATRALLRGSRARHLLSSNARTAVAGSGASRSRPTSSCSQSKTPYPAA
jgi:hypothetical protein